MTRFLLDPFRDPFMQRALLEVVVLGALAGVVSVHVLLRRLAFAGDALTHAVFPGIAIAFAAGQSLFLGALAAAAVAAVLMTAIGRIRRVDPDAAMAVILGAFFAFGAIVVSRTDSYTADLTALLFGRILTVDRGEIIESALVAAAVLAFLGLAHKELLLRAFDPEAATAMGYRPFVLDLALHASLALVVVASVRAVGTVLVIALVIVPAATSRLLSERVGPMMLGAVAVAITTGYLGLAISYEASIDHGVRLGSGATIVLVQVAAFAGAGAASALVRRRPARRTTITAATS